MNRPVQGTESREQLRAYIERVERLEEEKKALADDIRDVYAEAKGNGFDVKAMRAIVKLHKLDADERREQEAILETYMHALGMLADTPLGEAAVDHAVKTAAKDFRRSMAESFGKSVPLTEFEKARGLTSAFVDKQGMRTSFGVSVGGPKRTAQAADPPQEEMDHATSVKPPDRSDAHPGGAALVATSSSDEDVDIPPELDRRGGVMRC